jgi:metallo-beta-lactamase class B
LSAGLFLIGLVACAQNSPRTSPSPSEHFSIHVESVPPQTPANGIYVAGNFNGWNPADPNYRLPGNGSGKYAISFPDSVHGPIEFKLTLGSWNSVETDSAGKDIENRGAVAGAGNPPYIARVAAWRKAAAVVVREHTARPTVSIINESFAMPQLDRTRRVWIYLPPGYASSNERYPVLYMHDGQNLFDAATSFVGEWGVDETLDSLAAKGDKGAIVVGIDHGGTLRFNEYSPWKNAKYGGGEGDRYVDFLVKTLKPYVDSHYRTLPDRLNTGIAGSSMGGLISLYAIEKYPGVFSRAGIFSPALWVAPQAYDFTRESGALPSDVRLYFVMGGQEVANADEALGYVNDMKRMVDDLVSRGLQPGTNVVSYVRADGKHSEWFWRREFPEAYRWLFSK